MMIEFREHWLKKGLSTDTHTHDHEPITIEPDFYVFVPEREIDHFAKSVVRQVVD
jgi:hypothetical protein